MEDKKKHQDIWKVQMELVGARLKKRRMVLFEANDPCLLELSDLLGQSDRKTITLWALSLCEETKDYLKRKYPMDQSVEKAYLLTKNWAQGRIKMPAARKAILTCHGAAKEISSLEDMALYHALGQGLSVVHTVKHAMGYPIYELTAMVRRYGLEESVPYIRERTSFYVELLLALRQRKEDSFITWASFIE